MTQLEDAIVALSRRVRNLEAGVEAATIVVPGSGIIGAGNPTYIARFSNTNVIENSGILDLIMAGKTLSILSADDYSLTVTDDASIEGINTGDVSILDTASVDLTLSGQQISATVLPAGVDHNSLANLAVGDPHPQYLESTDVDTTFLKLDMSNGPILANMDFDGYKAIALACDNGTTFPATPSVGQWFYRSDLLTLFMYDIAWNCIINFAALSIYVDLSNGTNADGFGYASGANAFQTITYALSKLPATFGDNVTVYLSADTYAEAFIVPRNSGPGTLTIQGSVTVNESGTYTSNARNISTASGGSVKVNTVVGGSTTVTITGTPPTLYVGSIITANGLLRYITAMASPSSFTVNQTVDWYNGGSGYTFTYTHNIITKTASGWTADLYNGKLIELLGNIDTAFWIKDMDADWIQLSTLWSSAFASSSAYRILTITTVLKPLTSIGYGTATYKYIKFSEDSLTVNSIGTNEIGEVSQFVACMFGDTIPTRDTITAQGAVYYRACYIHHLASFYRLRALTAGPVFAWDCWYTISAVAFNLPLSCSLTVQINRGYYEILSSTTTLINTFTSSGLNITLENGTVVMCTNAAVGTAYVMTGTGMSSGFVGASTFVINFAGGRSMWPEVMASTYVDVTGDTMTGVLKTAGRIVAAAVKSANYSLALTDEEVTFTATATATLPTAPPIGTHYRIICRSGTLTIDGAGSDTVKGDLTYTLTAGDDLIITYTSANIWE